MSDNRNLAEQNDYERGFADGYNRGFDAGRQAQNPYAFTLTGAQPQPHAQPMPGMNGTACSCPVGTACMNVACPRRTSITWGGAASIGG